MSLEKKKGNRYFSLGIILSILFVILSLVWMMLSGIKDEKSDDLTWVG